MGGCVSLLSPQYVIPLICTFIWKCFYFKSTYPSQASFYVVVFHEIESRKNKKNFNESSFLYSLLYLNLASVNTETKWMNIPWIVMSRYGGAIFIYKFNLFEAFSIISYSKIRSRNVAPHSQIHNPLYVHIIFAHIIHEVYIGYSFGKLYLAQSRL